MIMFTGNAELIMSDSAPEKVNSNNAKKTNNNIQNAKIAKLKDICEELLRFQGKPVVLDDSQCTNDYEKIQYFNQLFLKEKANLTPHSYATFIKIYKRDSNRKVETSEQEVKSNEASKETTAVDEAAIKETTVVEAASADEESAKNAEVPKPADIDSMKADLKSKVDRINALYQKLNLPPVSSIPEGFDMEHPFNRVKKVVWATYKPAQRKFIIDHRNNLRAMQLKEQQANSRKTLKRLAKMQANSSAPCTVTSGALTQTAGVDGAAVTSGNETLQVNTSSSTNIPICVAQPQNLKVNIFNRLGGKQKNIADRLGGKVMSSTNISERLGDKIESTMADRLGDIVSMGSNESNLVYITPFSSTQGESSTNVPESSHERFVNWTEAPQDRSENEGGISPETVENRPELSPDRIGNRWENSPERFGNIQELSPDRIGHRWENSPDRFGNIQELSPDRIGHRWENSPNRFGNIQELSPDRFGNIRELSPYRVGNMWENSPGRVGNRQEFSPDRNRWENSPGRFENRPELSPDNIGNRWENSPGRVGNIWENSPGRVGNRREISPDRFGNRRKLSEERVGTRWDTSPDRFRRGISLDRSENKREMSPDGNVNRREILHDGVRNRREIARNRNSNRREISPDIDANRRREMSRDLSGNIHGISQDRFGNRRKTPPNRSSDGRKRSQDRTRDRRKSPPKRTQDRRKSPPNRTRDRRKSPPNRTRDRREISLNRTRDGRKISPNRTRDGRKSPPNRTRDGLKISPNRTRDGRKNSIERAASRRDSSPKRTGGRQEISSNVAAKKREISPKMTGDRREIPRNEATDRREIAPPVRAENQRNIPQETFGNIHGIPAKHTQHHLTVNSPVIGVHKVPPNLPLPPINFVAASAPSTTLAGIATKPATNPAEAPQQKSILKKLPPSKKQPEKKQPITINLLYKQNEGQPSDTRLIQKQTTIKSPTKQKTTCEESKQHGLMNIAKKNYESEAITVEKWPQPKIEHYNLEQLPESDGKLIKLLKQVIAEEITSTSVAENIESKLMTKLKEMQQNKPTAVPQRIKTPPPPVINERDSSPPWRETATRKAEKRHLTSSPETAKQARVSPYRISKDKIAVDMSSRRQRGRTPERFARSVPSERDRHGYEDERWDDGPHWSRGRQHESPNRSLRDHRSSSGHRSPNRSLHDHGSPNRSLRDHRSPNRSLSGHRSPNRSLSGHRSPNRHHDSQHGPLSGHVSPYRRASPINESNPSSAVPIWADQSNWTSFVWSNKPNISPEREVNQEDLMPSNLRFQSFPNTGFESTTSGGRVSPGGRHMPPIRERHSPFRGGASVGHDLSTGSRNWPVKRDVSPIREPVRGRNSPIREGYSPIRGRTIRGQKSPIREEARGHKAATSRGSRHSPLARYDARMLPAAKRNKSPDDRSPPPYRSRSPAKVRRSTSPVTSPGDLYLHRESTARHDWTSHKQDTYNTAENSSPGYERGTSGYFSSGPSKGVSYSKQSRSRSPQQHLWSSATHSDDEILIESPPQHLWSTAHRDEDVIEVDIPQHGYSPLYQPEHPTSVSSNVSKILDMIKVKTCPENPVEKKESLSSILQKLSDESQTQREVQAALSKIIGILKPKPTLNEENWLDSFKELEKEFLKRKHL